MKKKVDLEEIGGIGRPPLVTSTFPPRSKDDRLPETINIPNVGRVQLPTPQSPAKTETDPKRFDRSFGNLYVPDESAVERMTTSDGRVFQELQFMTDMILKPILIMGRRVVLWG